MTANQFTATLDDVTMWLNETENVINEQINSADKEQMSKYFENVKVSNNVGLVNLRWDI